MVFLLLASTISPHREGGGKSTILEKIKEWGFPVVKGPIEEAMLESLPIEIVHRHHMCLRLPDTESMQRVRTRGRTEEENIPATSHPRPRTKQWTMMPKTRAISTKKRPATEPENAVAKSMDESTDHDTTTTTRAPAPHTGTPRPANSHLTGVQKPQTKLQSKRRGKRGGTYNRPHDNTP